MINRINVLLIFCLTLSFVAQAQVASGVRHKMAIFTPLYIDDAFDNVGSYKYSGKNFPRQTINGLEFYHGAAIAIDSLNKLNIPLTVYVYDSKSKRETLEQQFSKCAADGVELVIANCSSADLATLARLGLDKKITVINATIPNDANAKNNPYFVVINPTIETQLEAMYHFINSKYRGTPTVVITRKTNSSDRYVRNVLETLNKYYKDSVKLSFREVNDDFALQALGTTSQPTETGLFLVGSLDTDFGSEVLKQFSASSKNYASLTVIGMPTWENLNLSNDDYKDVEIIYSTPFYSPKTDRVSEAIKSYYDKKMFARPSDLVFRAYGLTYKFGNMLNRYGNDINKNLASTAYRTFFDLNIKPAYKQGKLGYYENKKLYYLKFLNGALQAVN